MKHKGGIVRRFGVFFVLLTFLFPVFAYAEVLINEIAWMGSEDSANHEWIELYNNGETTDINDWTLKTTDGGIEISLLGNLEASEYYLLERTSDESVSHVEADQIYTGSLANSGEYLELLDSVGNIVDTVDASGGWLAGDNDLKLTMSLGTEVVWGDSLEVGGTPRSINQLQVDIEIPSDDGESSESSNEDIPAESSESDALHSSSGSSFSSSIIDYSKLVINEIMSNPSSGGDEWVEIYNSGNRQIDLGDCFVKEGSGGETILSGSIQSKKYFVVENPKGSLNNTGDTVTLVCAGRDIEKIVYGGESEVAVAPSPFSLARDESDGFVVTMTVTRGEENIIKSVKPDEVSKDEEEVTKGRVVISEVYPNPRGEDGPLEFLELVNIGGESVDLFAYIIENKQELKYVFKEHLHIYPGEYLVLSRDVLGLSLNNNTEKISLYKANRKTAIQKISYKSAPEAESLNCLDEYDFVISDLAIPDCFWSSDVTKGEKNKITISNRPPLLDFSVGEHLFARMPILFDSSDTMDQDGDELSYLWDFGDGFSSTLAMPDHTFAAGGKYNIQFCVSDASFTECIDRKINIIGWEVSEEYIASSTETDFSWDGLEISQILANPVGADADSEWIEIINRGEDKINLKNLQIDDKEGGSKAYSILESIFLDEGEKYLLSREDSGLALNNNGDEVRLISPDDSVIDRLKYEISREGEVIVASNGSVASTQKILITDNVSAIVADVDETNIYSNEYSLANIDETLVGHKLKVRAVVSVLPGVLATQYFYIYHDGHGLQVYNYKKDFPILSVGDMVLVSGEVSKTLDELRIKTTDKTDIEIISRGEDLKFKSIDCRSMVDEKAGALVSVKAVVDAKKGSTVTIRDTSGSASAYIRQASKIKLSSLDVGADIEVRGILVDSQDGKRLMPREVGDLIILRNSEGGVEGEELGEVLGAVIEGDEWKLAEREDENQMILYIFVIGIFLFGLGLYFWKFK